MCDFVKTKAHWNFSMLFSKILDQKVPSGEITENSNWRRILDIYREPLLITLRLQNVRRDVRTSKHFCQRFWCHRKPLQCYSNAVRPPKVSTRWLGSGNVVSKWPSRPASSSGCGEFPGKRAMLTIPMPTLTRKPSVRSFDVRARTRAFARMRSWSFFPSFILVLGVFHQNST